MPASRLEFHVEERSMEMFLRAWLSRFLPKNCTFGIRAYEGKEALLRKIGGRLKGYAHYMKGYARYTKDDFRIVVIVDQDRDDCKELKSRLEKICEDSGLRSKRAVGGPDWQVVTRIAIEELEAWYFGDWEAVRAAYPRVSVSVKARHRKPDAIKNGTWEAFEQVMKKHGYCKQRLAKTKAATEIGKHIDPTRNRSHSFKVFWNAIVESIA